MKTLIPATVLAKMFTLDVEAVRAVIVSGGGKYNITGVSCQGMLSNGQFVYDVIGENLPKHISTFKIKIARKPEWRASDPARILESDFDLCWA